MIPHTLLFPGGGTQYVGMGKELYDRHNFIRQLFEEADDLLGYHLSKILFEGPLDKLSLMDHSQPAILLVSVAMYEVYREYLGVKPQYACGHSLGEYSALVCSGVLKFADAIKLVKKRGELLQRIGDRYDAGMMAVSKVDASLIDQEVEKVNEEGDQVYIAVYNSPLQHVISGIRKGLKELKHKLESQGAQATILNINTPSHCPLMSEVQDEFKESLQHCDYGDFNFKVISNLTGEPYTDASSIIETLIQHMVEPVQWMSSIQFTVNRGINHAIDMGPQTVLKQLNPFINSVIKSYGFELQGDRENLRNDFEQAPGSLQNLLKRCLVWAVSSKNNNTDENEYHKGVHIPYEQLKSLLALDRTTPDHLSKGIELLSTILETKKVPSKERLQRMSDLQSGLALYSEQIESPH